MHQVKCCRRAAVRVIVSMICSDFGTPCLHMLAGALAKYSWKESLELLRCNDHGKCVMCICVIAFLGGSWVVISRAISGVTVLIVTLIRGRITPLLIPTLNPKPLKEPYLYLP